MSLYGFAEQELRLVWFIKTCTKGCTKVCMLVADDIVTTKTHGYPMCADMDQRSYAWS